MAVMALIQMVIDAETNVVAFRANNAPEMQLALNQYLNEAPEIISVYDVQLVGGGLAPNFLCALTVSSPEGGAPGVSYPANDLSAVVLGGMDGQSIDAVAMAQSLGAAIVDSGNPALAKTQIACGGGGPHWMGLGLMVA
jgi:hypothetical protein